MISSLLIAAPLLGKQVVYHALQDPSQDATHEAIAAISDHIDKLQNHLSSLKADEKIALAALAGFEAKPQISGLRQDIQRLEQERDAMQARLAEQHGDMVNLPAEERDKLEHDWERWQRYATVRRRICLEIWSKCTEVLPDGTTPQELWVSCPSLNLSPQAC